MVRKKKLNIAIEQKNAIKNKRRIKNQTIQNIAFFYECQKNGGMGASNKKN